VSARRHDAIVFALLLATYAWFYQGGFSNQNARFDLSLALALEHRATLDTFSANTIDKVLVGGHTYLEKAPGASWLALPVPLLASVFVSAADVEASPWLGDLLLWAGTVASVSLLTATAAVAFRRTLRLLAPDMPDATASALALVVFGATLVLPYATMLFGHAVAGSWLVIGLYGLLRAGRADLDARDTLRAAALGWFALGAVVLTEYPLAVPTAAVAAGAWLSANDAARRRSLLWMAPLALLPVAGVLVHNTVVFGGPLTLGYGKLQNTAFSSGMSRGLFGVALPSPKAALQLTFGTYRGLFVYAPVLLVAIASFRFWPRALLRTLGIPLLAGSLGLLLVISGYSFWQGGTCFGPRHLVGIVPLLGLGFAFLPQAWARSPLFALLVAVSALIALLGTAITPNVTEFELAPLTRAYLPLLRAGEISISPVAFLTPAAENAARHLAYRSYPWAAFNVGELLGLRGWWSVAPLGVAWMLAAWRITRRGPSER
jgi:hypothetical protein